MRMCCTAWQSLTTFHRTAGERSGREKALSATYRQKVSQPSLSGTRSFSAPHNSVNVDVSGMSVGSAPSSVKMTASRLFPLLSLLGAYHYAQAEVIAVYSIHRHGARNVLPKTSTLKEGDGYGGPTLLPQGKKQCYEAGQAFRRRYIQLDTCNDTCLTPAGGGGGYGLMNSPNASYSNYNTLSNSSALHRTLLSATSFLLGIFTAETTSPCTQPAYLSWQMVPVFTVEETEDYKIRAYTKCPAYDQALLQWFSSPEFKAKESETKPMREGLGQRAPGLNVSLANWWNVYDSFNVWKAYGVGDAAPDVDDRTYQEVVDLAMWLETRKMRSSLASNLLGGALLADLLARLSGAAQAVKDGWPTYLKLMTVSSHYNTQLGLLAALGADTVTGSHFVWLHKIPSPAAVMAVELHRTGEGDSSAFWVRLVAQDGPQKEYEVIPLACRAINGQGPKGACSMSDFVSIAGPKALQTAEDWCAACGNVAMRVCGAAARQRRALRRDT